MHQEENLKGKDFYIRRTKHLSIQVMINDFRFQLPTFQATRTILWLLLYHWIWHGCCLRLWCSILNAKYKPFMNIIVCSKASGLWFFLSPFFILCEWFCLFVGSSQSLWLEPFHFGIQAGSKISISRHCSISHVAHYATTMWRKVLEGFHQLFYEHHQPVC